MRRFRIASARVPIRPVPHGCVPEVRARGRVRLGRPRVPRNRAGTARGTCRDWRGPAGAALPRHRRAGLWRPRGGDPRPRDRPPAGLRPGAQVHGARLLFPFSGSRAQKTGRSRTSLKRSQLRLSAFFPRLAPPAAELARACRALPRTARGPRGSARQGACAGSAEVRPRGGAGCRPGARQAAPVPAAGAPDRRAAGTSRPTGPGFT